MRPRQPGQILASHYHGGERNDPGNYDGRGLRPLPEHLLDQGRRQAPRARVEGCAGLPRPQRGRPRLGALRLGRGGLAELRLRPRSPADHERGRAQGPAPAGTARRQLQRLERSNDMEAIKVGVIADQTGPLSFMGIANANVATMVVDDINAKGGLLGRQIDLYLEDSETTDSAAEVKAAKLVQQDHVDVVLGGIYSSTRQAIKQSAVVTGKTL